MEKENIVEINVAKEKSTINRRGLLRAMGATTATVTVATIAGQSEVEAQDNSTDRPAMRSPNRRVNAAGVGLPALPDVGIIAMNRMAFGPRAGDLQLFNNRAGTPEARLQSYVEEQLNPNSIPDPECDAKLAAEGFQTLDLSLQETWTAYVRREGEQNKDNDRYLPAKEVEKATFIRAVYSKRQLLEVLTEHWHDHFNVYGWDYWSAPVWNSYDRDVIRNNVLGNFRAMLEDVAQSPAMLYYLDNQSNEGGDPNENWAREVFELHGMGAENYLGVRNANDPTIFDEDGNRIGYIDEDVYGATTCFTGWRFNGDTGTFEYDDSRHFPFQKVVMGQTFPSFQGIKDGHDVLDIIASHPGTARYVCRRLCKRLISDNPPESVVQAAADVFHANIDAADQLKKVTRTILLSPEFQNTWGQKVKRPFEYTVSILRAANGDLETSNSFFYTYSNTGQDLFRWSPPDGYPDNKEAWITTMPFLQRLRIANWLLGRKYKEGPLEGKYRLDLVGQTPSAVRTPIEIVDFWSHRILGYALPANEYQPILDFMAFGRNPNQDLPEDAIEERLRHMIALIFMGPSFQWR